MQLKMCVPREPTMLQLLSEKKLFERYISENEEPPLDVGEVNHIILVYSEDWGGMRYCAQHTQRLMIAETLHTCMLLHDWKCMIQELLWCKECGVSIVQSYEKNTLETCDDCADYNDSYINLRL